MISRPLRLAVSRPPLPSSPPSCEICAVWPTISSDACMPSFVSQCRALDSHWPEAWAMIQRFVGELHAELLDERPDLRATVNLNGSTGRP